MAISFDTTLPSGYIPSTTSATSKSSVDYQSFLKLLIAQMKNQDPTSPMESTEYVAQIAAFSQVEQSVQMNQKLDQMMSASSWSEASALIGRTVTSADGTESGVVKEVKLASSGLVAITEDGTEIAIGSGVKVSEG
jgi:flagellar basal-body rod modification protein FlgD